MSKLKPVGLRTYEPPGKEEQGRGKTSCFQNFRNLIAQACKRHWAALSLHEQGRQVKQVIANVLIPNPLFGNIGRTVMPCERVQLAAWSTLTKGDGVSAKYRWKMSFCRPYKTWEVAQGMMNPRMTKHLHSFTKWCEILSLFLWKVLALPTWAWLSFIIATHLRANGTWEILECGTAIEVLTKIKKGYFYFWSPDKN